jgi:hypothetical protein
MGTYPVAVSELAAIATVLRCIGEVKESGALARKVTDIVAQELKSPGAGLHEPETRTEVFTGMPGTGGAGAAAYLTAQLADERSVVWTVELWIEKWDEESWSATVKGEIEVDDESGEPQTVFDVQRTVSEVSAAVDALRECADLVVAHELL